MKSITQLMHYVECSSIKFPFKCAPPCRGPSSHNKARLLSIFLSIREQKENRNQHHCTLLRQCTLAALKLSSIPFASTTQHPSDDTERPRCLAISIFCELVLKSNVKGVVYASIMHMSLRHHLMIL